MRPAVERPGRYRTGSSERAVHTWLDTVLDGPPAAEMTALVGRLLPHAHNDALGQKLLALTVPGIPDIYRAPNYGRTASSIPTTVDRSTTANAAKHCTVAIIRNCAWSSPRSPHDATGRRASCAAGISRCWPTAPPPTTWWPSGGRRRAGGGHPLTLTLAETGWGPTALTLPAGTWIDRITGARHHGCTPASRLFGELPVALLERADD